VFLYACKNDFNQCTPPTPDQNIIGKWNYTSTFVFGKDSTMPSNFTGVISFSKEGLMDDPYHLLPARYNGKLVERKLYWFVKDTLHVAFINRTDTLYAIDALLYKNECNGMTFGNWIAARVPNPSTVLTLSR
jgi:hypothetical protein